MDENRILNETTAYEPFSLTYEEIPEDLVIEARPPEPAPLVDESLEFHAARLLLLLKYAGGRKSRITGRTKLAKLDFFVRYPAYLSKALGDVANFENKLPPESPMIRYKYGPWDNKYYNVFALLVSKGLMEIRPTEKGDEFSLTDRGNHAVEEMEGSDFMEIIARCKLVYQRFKDKSGTQLKEFIYNSFPEIVFKPLGEEID